MMKKMEFSIQINSPKEKVWKALWDDASYRRWTSVFTEGSHAISDWKEGSKILFLGPKGDGMFSIIAKNIPNEQMSFRHMGEVKDGVEQPENEKTKSWQGAMENYHLSESNGSTHLKVDLDSVEEFADYFSGVFPKALEKVKEIAEE